ncbi:hypothetical protein AAMO2058_001642100 [Amorphochlora amoebiformis]
MTKKRDKKMKKVKDKDKKEKSDKRSKKEKKKKKKKKKKREDSKETYHSEPQSPTSLASPHPEFKAPTHEIPPLEAKSRGLDDIPSPDLSAEYWSKFTMLERNYESFIRPKRSQLLGEMQRLDTTRSLLENQAAQIEAQTKRFYDETLDRLHKAKVEKTSRIDREGTEVQLELKEMDRLGQEIAEFKEARTGANMARYLSSDRQLQHRLAKILDAPARVPLDINPYDLPRDHGRLHRLAREYEGTRRMIKVKDEMIGFLLKERNRLLHLHDASAKQVEVLNGAAKDEMKEWVRLTDRFAQELQEFKLVCRFCGIPLSRASVNSFCKYNRRRGWGSHNSGSEALGDTPGFGAEGSGLHKFEGAGERRGITGVPDAYRSRNRATIDSTRWRAQI